METFKILSYEEEQKLNISEKKKYYTELKEYLKNQKLSLSEIKNFTICEILNKTIVRKGIDLIKGYELEIRNKENIPNGPVIYASTHQDYNDHFNAVLSIPDHAIILNTSTVTRLFQFIMGVNGIIYVDREKQESRFNSKLRLMKYLSLGKSITVFPEGTYNCSPNKLHLPLHSGIFDMARKMQVPVVPMVQEYIYDTSDIITKDKVKKCIVSFGEPIYVSVEDSIQDKKQELSEIFSTIRYELMEEQGTYSRNEISNQEYINYVLGRIDAWARINVDINDERKTIYGYNDDFYLFHHINDVKFDKEGHLLPTDYVSMLDDIYTKKLEKKYSK